MSERRACVVARPFCCVSSLAAMPDARLERRADEALVAAYALASGMRDSLAAMPAARLERRAHEALDAAYALASGMRDSRP
jgi:hypothetical protein